MNNIDSVPYRLTIGVTGHRELKNTDELKISIKKVIDKILFHFPQLPKTKIIIRILSPLAEGADTLVVEEVLKYENSELDVVLPVTIEECIKEFSSEESRNKFKDLLNKTQNTYTLNKKSLKSIYPDDLLQDAKIQAYEDVGKYVVNHSDILIALWDKRSTRGKGGTAEIIEFAKQKACPIFIISTNSPNDIELIKGNGINTSIYKQIDKFNSYTLRSKIWNRLLKANIKHFFYNNARNKDYDLPEKTKTIASDLLLPYYTHAENFALKHQKWYRYIGLMIFWLAFLSLAVVGYGEIIFDHIPTYIFIIELSFLLLIIFLIFISKKRGTHQGYIENRFLAEHLRTDIFLTICGERIPPPQYVRHIKSTFVNTGWMLLVLEDVLKRIPSKNLFNENDFLSIRDYIRTVWIEDQIKYHNNKKKNLWKKDKALGFIVELIFYLAIIFALIHIFITIEIIVINKILLIAVLLFPALGATFSAIRSHRDYKNFITDSIVIINSLEELKQEIMKPVTKDKLRSIIEQIENVVRQETKDWLTLIASRELEKAV